MFFYVAYILKYFFNYQNYKFEMFGYFQLSNIFTIKRRGYFLNQ